MNRRQVQADQTRREILAAARDLFAQRGYAKTTVTDIARAAGVSVQTIYDSVGSKRAIVSGLNDLIDQEAGVGDLAGRIPEIVDPAELLGIAPAICIRIVRRCGDLIRIAESAAAAEPELGDVIREGRRRHTMGTRMIAGRLASLGALGPGADVDAAAGTLAVLSDTSFAILLADGYGWDLEQVEVWMNRTLHDLLLGPRGRM